MFVNQYCGWRGLEVELPESMCNEWIAVESLGWTASITPLAQSRNPPDLRLERPMYPSSLALQLNCCYKPTHYLLATLASPLHIATRAHPLAKRIYEKALIAGTTAKCLQSVCFAHLPIFMPSRLTWPAHWQWSGSWTILF